MWGTAARHVRKVPVSVEPLVRDAVESFGYVLAQQGFKVDVAIQPDLPEIPMDGEAVGQALANLIDNAIKYSAERRGLPVEAVPRGGRRPATVRHRGGGLKSPGRGLGTKHGQLGIRRAQPGNQRFAKLARGLGCCDPLKGS